MESQIEEKENNISKLNKSCIETTSLKDEEIEKVFQSVIYEKRQRKNEKESFSNLKQEEADKFGVMLELKKLLKSKVAKNKKLEDHLVETKAAHNQSKKSMKTD